MVDNYSGILDLASSEIDGVCAANRLLLGYVPNQMTIHKSQNLRNRNSTALLGCVALLEIPLQLQWPDGQVHVIPYCWLWSTARCMGSIQLCTFCMMVYFSDTVWTCFFANFPQRPAPLDEGHMSVFLWSVRGPGSSQIIRCSSRVSFLLLVCFFFFCYFCRLLPLLFLVFR